MDVMSTHYESKKINILCFLGLLSGVTSVLFYQYGIVLVIGISVSILGIITYQPKKHLFKSLCYRIIGLVLNLVLLSLNLHMWGLIEVPFYS